MIRIALLFLTFSLQFTLLFSQSFSVVSWNIQNLGRTKDDTEIRIMADILKEHDLVAIQEVVGKDPAGAQAVARIADELNRSGSRWDYRVSLPTQSPSSYISERYAILWKPSKLDLVGSPYLDRELADKIYREPYLAKFRVKKGRKSTFFHLINFHARRFDQKPEEEIQYFIDYVEKLGSRSFIIAGDFNLDEKHNVWRKLYRKGFLSALENVPTTLKRKCKRGNYFNHSIDNVYFSSYHMQLRKSGRIDFVPSCRRLKQARGISDHVPVFAKLEVR
ncbi:MAG: endonuclease/exonuclease/phosphatase family protein [Bacteroidota bacterium]